MSTYGFTADLGAIDFEAAIEKTTAALGAEGFGVLTTIDVTATFKKKLDVDFRPYRILGACNPTLAHKALSADPAIGLLLPCNVVVEATDAGVRVSIIDPKAMFQVVDLPGIEAIVDDARARLGRVRDALSA